MGRRLASQGYVVLVPNPFYRSAKGVVATPGFDFSKPEDRANLMVWLNSQGSNLPIPAPPAVDTPAELAAEIADQPAAPGKAEDEPVLNEATAPTKGEGAAADQE